MQKVTAGHLLYVAALVLGTVSVQLEVVHVIVNNMQRFKPNREAVQGVG